VQDLWPETFERLLPGPKWLRGLIAPFFLRGMGRRRDTLLGTADTISATSNAYLEAVAGRLATLGNDAQSKPTHVCNLGAYLQEYAELPRLSPTQIDASLEAGPDASQPVKCVYSGTLEAGQDLDTLITAARLLGSAGTAAEIHVAGTGSLEARLRSAAEGLRGPCRLIVHGLLERRDYVKLLAAADIGLVLVKPETMVALPNKACDYAAAGLAIVNSLPGELERLVSDHHAGLTYTAGDAASLARAIAAFATNRRLLDDCRQGSRRLAEAAFDREKTYLRFAKWLEASL
jgi:glycosyltransferase involved in cell wall biosynthesis